MFKKPETPAHNAINHSTINPGAINKASYHIACGILFCFFVGSLAFVASVASLLPYKPAIASEIENIEDNGKHKDKEAKSSPTKNVKKMQVQDKEGQKIATLKKSVPPSVREEILFGDVPHQITYGKANAPVVMVEYASLSCGACARFHTEILTPLKKDLIADGNLRVVFRHFPLNYHALKASLLTECAGTNKKGQMFLEAIFKTQKDWVISANKESLDKKLTNIGVIGGLAKDEIQACLNDEAKQQEILEHQMKVNKKLNINETPSVFINGELFEGRKTEKSIRKRINQLLRKDG